MSCCRPTRSSCCGNGGKHAGGVSIPQLPWRSAGCFQAKTPLLGHDKLDTTARYARVATGMIAGIKSPLDLLSQPCKKPEKNRKDQPPT